MSAKATTKPAINFTKPSGRGRALTEMRRRAGLHTKSRVRGRERRNAIAQDRRDG